jgi:mono/diheme cytochrome c family protein
MPAPKWITPFFYCSAGAALLALLLVFFQHDAERPALGGHAVADLTINLGGQPVREHCTTCHPAGSRPAAANGTRTVSPHPDITPHRTDQLGCTACHLGEGMALDLNVSHGLGARRILTGKDLQATCFSCHPAGPLAGAEPVWNGYRQFHVKACTTCHATGAENPGGFYGPDLSEIGSVLGLDRLQEAILEPDREPVNSRMPRFPLSKNQARQISYYLKSLMGTPLYTTPMQVQAGLARSVAVDLPPRGTDLSDGETLLYRQHCLACHKYAAVDGRIGPDLSYIGRQREPDALKTFLDNPTRLIPGAAMPRIPMTAATERQLLQFLVADAVGPAPAGDSRQLYMHLCQRCHAAEGDGHGPIQPNLANFPRAFTGNADFFRAVGDERLLDSLRRGIPGTSMPGYGKLFDEQRSDRLLDLIFAVFIGLERQEKSEPTPLPQPPDRPTSQRQTDALFRENCARCHGAFGTGTGPDALDHLPRPRNLRNQPYFAAVADRRIARAVHDGVPGTAMPAFRDHLEARDIWSLVGKIRAWSRTQER